MCVHYLVMVIFTENATSVEIGELLAELDLTKTCNLLGHCNTPSVFVLLEVMHKYMQYTMTVW